MLKRMIITLSIVSIITMGAAPAQANIWDLLTGAITGASSWAGKATKDLKNLVTAARQNAYSAAAKSYAWAYDTGSKANKWSADTSGAVWNGIADTATNLGTDLTQCRDNISDPGFNTFVQYQNEIPISLGIGFADTNCNATGSKKQYNIPNKSGGSCVPAKRIDGCSFPTASYTVSTPVGSVVTVDSSTSNLFSVRDKNLMKPTCVQHDICYNSKPAAGYNATTWKAKCDAEFWDNMNTVRQKFKGRFSAELAYAAVVAGGQTAFNADQNWASTNTCNSAVNDQNTLGLPLFRQAADVDGDGQDEFCRQIGGDIVCSSYDRDTGVFTEKSRIGGDLGYTHSRWLADANGDGKADYCREVGDKTHGFSIGCTSFPTPGSTSTTYHIPGDMGYEGDRWFADVNGDGQDEYCSAVGGSSTKPAYILCTRYNPSTPLTSDSIVRLHLGDFGYKGQRWFADVDGNGTDDYCREVGNRGKGTNASSIICTTIQTNGTTSTFTGYSTYRISGELGYRDSRWFADVNHDGKADYCRKAGTYYNSSNTKILCDQLQGPGVSQKRLLTIGHSDIGFYHPRLFADFTGDGQMDYLRSVGASSARKLTVLQLNPNHPPVADAGAAQTVESTGSVTAVTLNGSASSDPDGNPLTYNWVWAGGSATGVSPTVNLANGTHNIRLKVDDGKGGTATATTSVAVQDTIAPTVSIAAIPASEATSASGAVVDVAPYVTTADVCGVSLNISPVGTFALGVTTVSVTATDCANNSTSATTTVTVQDTTAPVITPPADITTEATAVQTPVVIGTATATDIFAVSVTSDAPATFPVGTTVVTWTARDANGNTSTATQNVTVVDSTPPSIIAPADLTLEATGNPNTPFVLTIPAVATDAVGVANITSDAIANFPLGFPYGASTVTWTATDAAGNSSTATQTITVVDTTPPSLNVAANVTVEATGALTAASLGSASGTDLFGPVTFGNDAPASYAVGATTIHWTATDANGNSTTATQTVMVTDHTAPVITAPANVSIEANAVNSIVAIGTATASDLVDGVVSVSNNAPATFPLGSTTVTYTSTDAHGNTATATQTVTVADTTPPVLTVPANVSVEANAVSSTVAIGTASATDIFGASVTNDAPATFPLGTTTVTYTATDGNGLTTTGTQTVTVVDTTAPAVTAKLVSVGMEEDEAIFRVTFSATDIADPNPTVTASLNGSSVTNGQIVKLKRDDEMKAEFEHGKLEIKGMNFSLNVSATDASGNKGNAADAFAFAPEHHDGDKKHGKKKKDKDHKDG